MNQILKNNLAEIISSSSINLRVTEIANDINNRYCSKSLLVIGVLNGSFIFLADLVRCLKIDVEISFIKARSYNGKQKSDIIQDLRMSSMRLLVSDRLSLGQFRSTETKILKKKREKGPQPTYPTLSSTHPFLIPE